MRRLFFPALVLVVLLTGCSLSGGGGDEWTAAARGTFACDGEYGHFVIRRDGAGGGSLSATVSYTGADGSVTSTVELAGSVGADDTFLLSAPSSRAARELADGELVIGGHLDEEGEVIADTVAVGDGEGTSEYGSISATPNYEESFTVTGCNEEAWLPDLSGVFNNDADDPPEDGEVVWQRSATWTVTFDSKAEWVEVTSECTDPISGEVTSVKTFGDWDSGTRIVTFESFGFTDPATGLLDPGSLTLFSVPFSGTVDAEGVMTVPMFYTGLSWNRAWGEPDEP